MDTSQLAFVDIETSGSSIRYDRVIEIGIVKVKGNECIDTFQSLINPQTYVSPFIEQMTGINTKELEDAPVFEHIAQKIYDFCQDSIFVAHNVRFDLGFLKNEFRRYGINFSPKHFCSVRLSRSLFPQYRRHNLDTIIERFAIACPHRHRALDDAKVIWEFFQKVQKTIPQKILTKHIDKLLKKPSLPTHLPPSILDTLPESPGVYIFYGDNNIPLYIGKSVNVKDRIMNHFSSDYTSSKQMNMCQQIKNIETIPTAGELGALLTESSLIKKLQPVFNRQLRVSRHMYVLKQYMDNEGFYRINLQEAESIEPRQLPDVVGMFRGKRQVKEYLRNLVKEYELCETLLGLEKKAPCFAHKLHVCHGACCGKEQPVRYNMRFIQAFSKTKIKSWPFRGSIAIHEQDEFTEKEDRFIINNWCLLTENASEISFDYDTYKILVRFILNEQNIKKMKLLVGSPATTSTSPSSPA